MPDRMPWHPEGVGFVDLGVTEIGADAVSCQPEARVTWGRAHPDDQFRPAPGTLVVRMSNASAHFIPSLPPVAYWPKPARLRIRRPGSSWDERRISAIHSAYHRKTKGRR